MPIINYLTSLLEIQGFRVVKVERKIENERSGVILELERTTKNYICSGCGRQLTNAYDSRLQVVQHLSLWQHVTYLRFKRYRLKCPDCGVKVEALDFVDKYARVTTALSALVYELCKVMTCKAAALFQCLHWGTVKAIDKSRLQKAQKERPLNGITAIGIDEISIGKGHNYWHLISALCSPRGPELLYIGEGRKEKDIKGFWRWFGKKKTRQVKVAVMDMWKGFINSFKDHCPGISIIYDKFHIIRHLLDALNKVRKHQLMGAGKRLRGLLAGKKFVLLSRQAHLRGKAKIALNELLSFSPSLLKAHLLKENLSHLWSYKSRTWACKFWQSWKDCLKWSRLKPYQAFARMMDKHLDGILAYCDYKIPLGFIEAANLKARNIIRRAYGYRDKEYMKLKIIQARSPLGAFHPWGSIITHYNSS